MIKRLLFAFVCVPMLSLAQTGEKNFIDQHYIEVTGRAEMEIVPDEIYITILLDEKDSKNKQTVAQLESAMTKKLKELGVDVDKDLMIKDLSSNFKFYLLHKNDIFLSKEYQLLVRNGKLAGRVFIELEKLGISNMTIDRLEHSKIEQYRREVKVNAIVAAKEKAGSLANAISEEIGKALYIQEVDYNPYGVARVSNVMSLKSREGGSLNQMEELDIEFEKIKLEYSVICRFELK